MSQPTHATFQIGLVGGDRTLLAMLGAALAPIGEVVAVSPTALGNLSLLLFIIDAQRADSIAALVPIFERNPNLPVFVLGRDLPADIAVELVKCGATDFLSLPAEGDTLRRKAERALLQRPGPTIDLPEFAAFNTPTAATQNRRTSYRARVWATHPAFVRIALSGTEWVRVEVSDLSLATEQQLGGMSLHITPANAHRLPLASWTKGTLFPVQIELPNVRTRVEARAIIVRLHLPPPGPIRAPLSIGIQYTLDHANDERLLERFWVECQRMNVPVKTL